MNLFLFVILYFSLIFSYIAYKIENITFAYLFLIIAGLNLVALTILLLDGGDYNI